MYTLKQLKEENMSYHYEHVLTNSDVEKVNNTLSLIESSRTDSIPKQGDIIEYTNKHQNTR